jgi:hypothetical protein
MDLINTYGGSESTAYITVDAANTLISTTRVFYEAWTAANTIQQRAAILQAAKQIASQHWVGRKYFARQRLSFPRVPDEFDSPLGGHTGAPDSSFYEYIALEDYHRLQRERVEAANAYQALYILEGGGEDPYREDQLRGLSGRQKSIRFMDSWYFREPSHVLCPEAWDELRYYKATGPRIVRGGSGGESRFSE